MTLVTEQSQTWWETNNPTPADQEYAVDTETARVKIGDGVRPWADLDYFGEPQFRAAEMVAVFDGGTS